MNLKGWTKVDGILNNPCGEAHGQDAPLAGILVWGVGSGAGGGCLRRVEAPPCPPEPPFLLSCIPYLPPASRNQTSFPEGMSMRLLGGSGRGSGI